MLVPPDQHHRNCDPIRPLLRTPESSLPRPSGTPPEGRTRVRKSAVSWSARTEKEWNEREPRNTLALPKDSRKERNWKKKRPPRTCSFTFTNISETFHGVGPHFGWARELNGCHPVRMAAIQKHRAQRLRLIRAGDCTAVWDPAARRLCLDPRTRSDPPRANAPSRPSSATCSVAQRERPWESLTQCHVSKIG